MERRFSSNASKDFTTTTRWNAATIHRKWPAAPGPPPLLVPSPKEITNKTVPIYWKSVAFYYSHQSPTVRVSDSIQYFVSNQLISQTLPFCYPRVSPSNDSVIRSGRFFYYRRVRSFCYLYLYMKAKVWTSGDFMPHFVLLVTRSGLFGVNQNRRGGVKLGFSTRFVPLYPRDFWCQERWEIFYFAFPLFFLLSKTSCKYLLMAINLLAFIRIFASVIWRM